MTKRNKKKTPSNITAQSVFVSEGQSSNTTREPTGSLSTSTSADTLTASVPNSPQPPSQLRERGLEDQDHSDDEDTPLTNNTNSKTTTKSTKKQLQQATKKTDTSFSASWTPTARETSATSLWAWLTASRAISGLQFEHESKEEWVRKAAHDQKLAELLGEPLGEHERLLKKNKSKSKNTDDDEEDLKKKNAIYSWDQAKMQQAFDLTSRDWVALSALTVATLGVRLWRISWPDEVVYVLSTSSLSIQKSSRLIILTDSCDSWNWIFGLLLDWMRSIWEDTSTDISRTSSRSIHNRHSESFSWPASVLLLTTVALSRLTRLASNVI